MSQPARESTSERTTSRTNFLSTARSVVGLLRAPAVAARWTEPSALPEFRVSGLAGHLAGQVFHVERLLGTVRPPDSPLLSLIDHYARSPWVAADLNDEVNVRLRQRGEETATAGAAALAERVATAVDGLADTLPTAPADRVVHLPWGPWSLSLDDFLVTRMMELVVHSDDLAVSVDVATPDLPDAVYALVLDLLTGLAVRRHGPTAVLRALSRAERAPGSIAAF
jgi:hypothetical protein